MAVILGWFVGALVVVAIASTIIELARKKAGKSDRVGSIIYAIWVSLALYGAGAREDYSFAQASFYVIGGFALIALVLLVRPKKAKLRTQLIIPE